MKFIVFLLVAFCISMIYFSFVLQDEKIYYISMPVCVGLVIGYISVKITNFITKE